MWKIKPFFKSSSLRTKLLSRFAVVILVIGGVSIASYWALRGIINQMQVMVETTVIANNIIAPAQEIPNLIRSYRIKLLPCGQRRIGIAFPPCRAHCLGRVNAQIKAINQELERMKTEIRKVEEDSLSIATIAEQSLQRSQEVAASTEEQVASLEEALNSASILSRMALELQNMVKQFKL
ncbi:MCP four helix bundle domain-containing protein [Capillibacterium thermochitinicola]|uniref:Methyl-accepting chemotaxis protein n=1 Tax=Capillibacterium thermochitinicola TaxID=2699427 RepID=A0A8J6LMB2_9FIRM|nr:methyl-accepting chemotaxis protein [Capillibacterium thermochitinicola]MBA2133534.1 methyl-accepting chemotaxis protein [Capillibacterium thermochitinicola]